MKAGTLPLSDVRVLDSGHTVMGLIAGLILATLAFLQPKLTSFLLMASKVFLMKRLAASN